MRSAAPACQYGRRRRRHACTRSSLPIPQRLPKFRFRQSPTALGKLALEPEIEPVERPFIDSHPMGGLPFDMMFVWEDEHIHRNPSRPQRCIALEGREIFVIGTVDHQGEAHFARVARYGNLGPEGRIIVNKLRPTYPVQHGAG